MEQAGRDGGPIPNDFTIMSLVRRVRSPRGDPAIRGRGRPDEDYPVVFLRLGRFADGTPYVDDFRRDNAKANGSAP